LIAANQSFLRRFPVKAPKPQEVIDLEKPDDEDVTLKWNEMIGKANAAAKMEQAQSQLKDWQDKLDKFNEKVPQPENKPVEIIQQDQDETVPHIDLVGQKKTEDKEIAVDNTKDGFDPDEVMFDMITEPEVDKEKQLEEFKKREQEEKAELERIAEEAKQEDEKTVHELLEEGFEEQQKKEAEEEQRIKPDFTEVIEPEVAVTPKKTANVGMLGVKVVDKKGKVVEPPKPTLPDPAEMTEEERTGLLNKLHAQHGKFEDISDEQLKMERDESNRAQYLADVSLTKEEAEAHGPITESRMAFFQDIIDDILRGDTTFENVPEENRKMIAHIMDPELPNPDVITKGSALKEQRQAGLEETSAEGLKEKFMIQPKTEERPMTDAELDALLEGWEEEQKPKAGEKTKMVIRNGKRVYVPIGEPKTGYVQNEEQNDQTLWQKTKELDIPEPEKNEIILPDLGNTVEDVPEIAESISIEQNIPNDKFEKYKKRLTSEEDYHQRVEARINDLITKLDNKEIQLSDLSEEDKKVIIDILNQND